MSRARNRPRVVIRYQRVLIDVWLAARIREQVLRGTGRASRVRDVAVSRGASSQGDSRLVRGAIVVVLAASMRRTRATCGSHEGWWSVFRAPRTCTCLNSSGVRSSLIASHSPPRGARCRSAFGRQDRRCRRAVLQISEVYGMDQVGVMFEQALHESGAVL